MISRNPTIDPRAITPSALTVTVSAPRWPLTLRICIIAVSALGAWGMVLAALWAVTAAART